MKKLLFTGIFFIVFAMPTNAFNFNECIEEMNIDNLNSKNLLSYIKDNHFTDKVMKVCSEDTCSTINFASLEQDIKNFIKENLSLLKEKDMETAIEAELKGFKINKISVNACE